jgi:hypothetical protein
MGKAAIILGVLLAVLVAATIFYRARRLRAKRLILESLKDYFKGGVSAEQLRQRAEEIAGRRFIHGSYFYAMSVTAFQRAVDDQLTRPHSADDERTLLGRLASLKTKCGLVDLYQTQGWRAGRE